MVSVSTEIQYYTDTLVDEKQMSPALMQNILKDVPHSTNQKYEELNNVIPVFSLACYLQ